MARKLVMFNAGSVLPIMEDMITVVDLEPASLAKRYPKLAEALGRGRVISHQIVNLGSGVVITFLVDD